LTYSKKDETEQPGTTVLRATNIDLATNLLDLSDLRYIRASVAVPESKKLKPDSLLICTASGSKSHLGKVAYIDIDADYAFGGFMGMLTPKADLLPRYLFHAMTTPAYKAFIGSLTDGANINNLRFDSLARFPIPVPPLAEQRRIVAMLDDAFEGIAAAKANAEKNLRNARTVFESYRDATFTSLEQEASLKPLEDMVDDIATGPFGSLLHKSDYEEGGIPLVNPINIEDDVIVPDERKAVSTTTAKRLTRYRLKAGDIAVGRRGDIGRCAVVSPEQDGWLCGTGCFVIRAGKGVSPDFLAHLLRSRPYRMQLVAKAGRATMPSISNKDLADLQIPAVSPERQKNALEGFGELSAYSSQAEEVAVRKLAALDELKASLLHQAFTGAL
jgi:type I restriction enzyme S subunit